MSGTLNDDRATDFSFCFSCSIDSSAFSFQGSDASSQTFYSLEEIQFPNCSFTQFLIAFPSIVIEIAITISIYSMQVISLMWNEESNLLKLIHTNAQALVWMFTFRKRHLWVNINFKNSDNMKWKLSGGWDACLPFSPLSLDSVITADASPRYKELDRINQFGATWEI